MLFFFFKQKTAYEIKECDWSSDVCSSDLKLMKMHDWLQKLDDFLKVSEKELLTHTGQISHSEAIEKARYEYSQYRKVKDKEFI